MHLTYWPSCKGCIGPSVAWLHLHLSRAAVAVAVAVAATTASGGYGLLCAHVAAT